jgi:mono/diheme cytochrome c family protein
MEVQLSRISNLYPMKFLAALLILLAELPTWPQTTSSPIKDRVEYNRDIRPILANNCFACHGADMGSRQAGLRLDTFVGATAKRGAFAAILPGNPGKSLLTQRIVASEARKRMPPPSTGKQLKLSEIKLLNQWIQEGAKYDQHWAFVKPKLPTVPSIQNPKSKIRNPIDNYVLAELSKHGLKPSPEADRFTLVRRLYLDLIGLLPTPKEVQDFVQDKRPDAYEQLVDRLLASPHYGERWARRWLDVARYADTNGYEKDRERSIWPYRDWVIKALNADMPFDQFTIKQLAGDLLPNPTINDLVATGFHRNTMQNEEGGIDIAEDRFKQMVDRTNTTGAAWLGLTVNCTQCHNHKFDPLTQKEFYGLYALLNNTDELEIDLPSDDIQAKRTAIQAQIEKLKAERLASIPGGKDKIRERAAEWVRSQRANAVKWMVLKPMRVTSKYDATMDVLEDGSVLASGNKPNTDTYEMGFHTDRTNLTAMRLEVLTDASLPDNGPGRAHFFQRGGFLLSEVGITAIRLITGAAPRIPVVLKEPSADFEAPGRSIAQTLDGKLDTGWMVTGQEGKDHRAVFQFENPVGFPEGTLLVVGLDQYFVHQCTIGRFRISVTDQPLPVRAAPFAADVEAAICHSEDIRSDAEWAAIEREYLNTTPELSAFNKKIVELEKSLPAYNTTMVLRERPANHPRTTNLYKRGEYLKPAVIVIPSTPAILHTLPGSLPRNRLGLAKWLVSPDNPLTARVIVNREWQAFFGRGIVETLEDFGTRGSAPTHPELLDWLAVSFRDGIQVFRYSGIQDGNPGSAVLPEHLNTRTPEYPRPWSLKSLHRLIVTSAIYRQSARVTPEVLAKDPSNRYYARAPRFRVDAEVVRDIALSACGLLNPKIGGPSVFPPQPPEVTGQVYGGGGYTVSTGPDRYRRGLYTHMKRTAPFAASITFDAPTSETTCMRRVRSNTPLQALTTLNDEVFMEAAEALARKVMLEGGTTDEQRIEYLYHCVLSRKPAVQERQRIERFLTNQRSKYQADEKAAKEAACKYLPSPKDIMNFAELAAWTLSTRAVLNLDEAVTKG